MLPWISIKVPGCREMPMFFLGRGSLPPSHHTMPMSGPYGWHTLPKYFPTPCGFFPLKCARSSSYTHVPRAITLPNFWGGLYLASSGGRRTRCFGVFFPIIWLQTTKLNKNKFEMLQHKEVKCCKGK